MSFFHNKKGLPTPFDPNKPTRQGIIDLYIRYGRPYPEETVITAHLGNPGGLKAIELMLHNDANQIAPDVIDSDDDSDDSNDNLVFTPAQIPVKITKDNHKVSPNGMSYWRIINNHQDLDYLKIACAINGWLKVLTISKRKLELVDEQDYDIPHSGECLYFSAIDPNILFYQADEALMKLNIMTKEKESVFSIPSKKIWQCHTSYDDKVHSATIKDENYQFVSWGVSIDGNIRMFSIREQPDECQIDKSGRFLLIKEMWYNEDIGKMRDINRIISLETGINTGGILYDETGQAGHSDCGFESLLGEDDKYPRAGSLVQWNMNNPLGNSSRRLVYSTGIWNMGYVSFTNAKPGIPTEKQKCLISTPSALISVKIGQGHSKFICNHGTESDKYEHRVKASLCPHGEFAAYTSFINGRLDLYVVRIPSW